MALKPYIDKLANLSHCLILLAKKQMELTDKIPLFKHSYANDEAYLMYQLRPDVDID